jgi:hypothetical protein
MQHVVMGCKGARMSSSAFAAAEVANCDLCVYQAEESAAREKAEAEAVAANARAAEERAGRERAEALVGQRDAALGKERSARLLAEEGTSCLLCSIGGVDFHQHRVACFHA